jgi:hypothetical protein
MTACLWTTAAPRDDGRSHSGFGAQWIGIALLTEHPPGGRVGTSDKHALHSLAPGLGLGSTGTRYGPLDCTWVLPHSLGSPAHRLHCPRAWSPELGRSHDRSLGHGGRTPVAPAPEGTRSHVAHPTSGEPTPLSLPFGTRSITAGSRVAYSRMLFIDTRREDVRGSQGPGRVASIQFLP